MTRVSLYIANMKKKKRETNKIPLVQVKKKSALTEARVECSLQIAALQGI